MSSTPIPQENSKRILVTEESGLDYRHHNLKARLAEVAEVATPELPTLKRQIALTENVLARYVAIVCLLPDKHELLNRRGEIFNGIAKDQVRVAEAESLFNTPIKYVSTPRQWFDALGGPAEPLIKFATEVIEASHVVCESGWTEALQNRTDLTSQSPINKQTERFQIECKLEQGLTDLAAAIAPSNTQGSGIAQMGLSQDARRLLAFMINSGVTQSSLLKTVADPLARTGWQASKQQVSIFNPTRTIDQKVCIDGYLGVTHLSDFDDDASNAAAEIGVFWLNKIDNAYRSQGRERNQFLATVTRHANEIVRTHHTGVQSLDESPDFFRHIAEVSADVKNAGSLALA